MFNAFRIHPPVLPCSSYSLLPVGACSCEKQLVTSVYQHETLNLQNKKRRLRLVKYVIGYMKRTEVRCISLLNSNPNTQNQTYRVPHNFPHRCYLPPSPQQRLARFQKKEKKRQQQSCNAKSPTLCTTSALLTHPAPEAVSRA